MAPRTKERYNAKARQSSVGGSSHKKRRKLKTRLQDGDEGEGSNAVLIDPEIEAARKEADRQRREVGPLVVNTRLHPSDSVIARSCSPCKIQRSHLLQYPQRSANAWMHIYLANSKRRIDKNSCRIWHRVALKFWIVVF